MSNNLTIQINSLEALERLIGGDSQVEVEVRNSVVQRFAEKHLKPLANSPAIKNTFDSIRNGITKDIQEKCEKEIATFKTNYYGTVTELQINPTIKAQLHSMVRSAVDEKIAKEVEEALKTWRSDSEVQKMIDKRFEYYTNDFINTQIKTRLDKLKANL